MPNSNGTVHEQFLPTDSKANGKLIKPKSNLLLFKAKIMGEWYPNFYCKIIGLKCPDLDL